MKLMNRWFTRYLFGVQNGVEKDPRSWIVREGKKRTEPTPYEDYPHPKASMVSLHPGNGGNEIGRLGFKPIGGQGKEKLIDNYEINGASLASQQKSENRLLYALAKLSRPVHISGTPRIRIKVASSQPAANLSVWLVSLPWKKGGALICQAQPMPPVSYARIVIFWVWMVRKSSVSTKVKGY